MFTPCEKCAYQKYKCLGCVLKGYLDSGLNHEDVAHLKEENENLKVQIASLGQNDFEEIKNEDWYHV